MAKTVQLKSKLTMDTTQFKRAMDQAKASTARLGGILKGVGMAGFAAATATAAASLSAAATKFDRIGKLSKQFGASTDFLQNVAKSAELAGVNLESVAKIQRKLITSARDASRGMKTQSEAFADLGINLEEFLKMNADQKFAEFSRTISQAGDDSFKLGAAIQLGGRAVGDALPLLKDYKTVLADINKEAAVTAEQIRNIEALNDSLATLKQRLVDLAAPSLSGLNEFLDGVERLFGGGTEVKARDARGIGTRNKAMREREKENDRQWEEEREKAREERRRAMALMARKRAGTTFNPASGAIGLGGFMGVAAATIAGVSANQSGGESMFNKHQEDFSPSSVFEMFGAGGQARSNARAARSVNSSAVNKGNLLINSSRALAGRQDLGVQGFSAMNSISGAERRRRRAAIEAKREGESDNPVVQRLDKSVTALQSIDEKMTSTP